MAHFFHAMLSSDDLNCNLESTLDPIRAGGGRTLWYLVVVVVVCLNGLGQAAHKQILFEPQLSAQYYVERFG